MLSELTTDGEALRLFFTDDVYLVNEPEMQLNVNRETEKPQVKVETNPVTLSFKSLGNNRRNILIIVNDDENEVSDEKGRELLRKIVKSINLSANDFALLNYASCKSASFTQLTAHFQSVVVFAFGVSPQQLGLPAHPENMMVMEGNIKLICTAELRKLEEDPNGKKALWGSLKKLEL